MGLLLPGALWLLSVALPVVLLYFLKLRRREEEVSSVLLWRRFVEDVQANAPFKRPRFSLLLLLQLLALALLVLALSRPYARATAEAGQNVVLVLDASGSMLSRDERPSRFERAKATALKMVSDMSRGDRMAVVLSGPRAVALCPLTSDKVLLRRAISSARCTAAECDLSEALALASGMVRGKRGAEIVVLSDGGSKARPPAALLAPVRFVKFGRTGENVAIVALDVRESPLDPRKVQAFVSVANFGHKARQVDLEVRVDGFLVDVLPLTVSGGSERPLTFEVRAEAEGLLQIGLSPSDALPEDNVAYAPLRPPKVARVLVVTRGNPYIERALSSLPGVSVHKVAPGDFSGVRGYDAVIFDGFAPPHRPSGRGIWLAFGAAPTWGPALPGKVVKWTEVVEGKAGHPLLKFADLSGTVLSRCTVLKPKPWAEVLARTEEGPVAVAGEGGIVFGFDLLRSDLPLRTAFPIMMANFVEMARARREAKVLSCRAGEAVELRLGAEPVKVRTPDGREFSLRAPGGGLTFSRTEEVGVYEFRAGGGRKLLAVSMLSPSESDIRPRGMLDLGQVKLPHAPTRGRRNLELWPLLALLALLVLSIEWAAFHRWV